jgi:CheY-like chemotaxis protein
MIVTGASMSVVDENHCNRRGSLHYCRVLIVEDEAIVALLVAESLRDAGADVVGPAGSVEQALGLITAVWPDGGLSAAVLDINLGGQIVWPVANRLASLGVPFLFATGYGWNFDRRIYPAAPVLAKPFDIDALIATVANIASVRQSIPGVSQPRARVPGI